MIDNNKKYVEEKIKVNNKKMSIKRFLAAGLMVSNLLTLSGCAKEVPCEVTERHAHYYTNENNYGRYIVSEKSSVSGLYRSIEYIPVSKTEAEYLEFINKKKLFRIDENIQAISDTVSSLHDYKEYRYWYSVLRPKLMVQPGNKLGYVYLPEVCYDWSTEIHNTSTGEERICHYVYYGYKVIMNEKGKYEAIESEPVDDISELPEGYDYIKEDFYDIVHTYDKEAVLNFEDDQEQAKTLEK